MVCKCQAVFYRGGCGKILLDFYIVDAMLTPSDSHYALKADTISASIVNSTCVIILDMVHQRSPAWGFSTNEKFRVFEPVRLPLERETPGVVL